MFVKSCTALKMMSMQLIRGTVRRFSTSFLLRQKVYVCGIQPTGVPHVGNYLGFIQNVVQLQEEGNAQRFLFIADLHSIAVGFVEPAKMKQNLLEIAAALLACGVDPERTIFFQQSRIPEHAELAWILGGFQTVPALQRMPQYKDKSQRFKSGAVPVGLMCYPLLQAADVLLYRATHVPVGEDQNHHIHIIRDMATAFRNTFKSDILPVPEKLFSYAPRVRSLYDPLKKMSKSDKRETSRILISDSSTEIMAKCMRATSDSISQIYDDPIGRPAISNLIRLNSHFSGRSIKEVVEAACEMNTVDFKKDLQATIDTKLAPIRAAYYDYCARKDEVYAILDRGYEHAKAIAVKNITEVKKIIGFD